MQRGMKRLWAGSATGGWPGQAGSADRGNRSSDQARMCLGAARSWPGAQGNEAAHSLLPVPSSIFTKGGFFITLGVVISSPSISLCYFQLSSTVSSHHFLSPRKTSPPWSNFLKKYHETFTGLSLFLIKIELIYNVVLVSGTQNDSYVCVWVCVSVYYSFLLCFIRGYWL